MIVRSYGSFSGLLANRGGLLGCVHFLPTLLRGLWGAGGAGSGVQREKAWLDIAYKTSQKIHVSSSVMLNRFALMWVFSVSEAKHWACPCVMQHRLCRLVGGRAQDIRSKSRTFLQT